MARDSTVLPSGIHVDFSTSILLGEFVGQWALHLTVEENQMKSNMCNADRVVRAVVGLALIGATISGLIGLWGWLGIVLLATAAVSYCPFYKLIGFNSCDVCTGGTRSP